MRYIPLSLALIAWLAPYAIAQTTSTPVAPSLSPNQSTPEVIVPPRTVDPGVVVAPKVPPAADPNTLVPGQRGIGLSEADARQALADAGYTAVSNLVRRPDGEWTASARRNGSAVAVVVDRTGRISSN